MLVTVTIDERSQQIRRSGQLHEPLAKIERQQRHAVPAAIPHRLVQWVGRRAVAASGDKHVRRRLLGPDAVKVGQGLFDGLTNFQPADLDPGAGKLPLERVAERVVADDQGRAVPFGIAAPSTSGNANSRR